jgi:predicted dehydrogenase
MAELKWGIIGLGNIARAFARGLAGSQTGKLVAVGSRAQESADRFGSEFEVEKRYPSYEQLLADDQVEAVYVATPHPLHPEWVFQAAAAGKHILCEKPLAINQAQAMAMIDAAARHDVFLMEAFMYRCHPQTQKLVDLVRDGAVGEVRAMQGSFAFNAGFNPEGRLFSQALGGGGILDVGCYPVSMARLIAGAALGRDFADPEEVHAVGHLCQTGVDGWTFAALKFANDIIAQVGTGIQVTLDNTFTIFGSEGKIVVPSPWIPAREGGETTIQLHKGGEALEEIEVSCAIPLYGVEADTVARYIDERQARSPAMSWADTLGNMGTLDRWREAIGFTFDEEKPEHQKP